MPFLVCDRPPAGEGVEYYTIAGLPGDPEVQLSDLPEYGLKYNLSDLPPGTYNVRMSACNQWVCSLPAPLEFTVLETPSTPLGLNILRG